jgi:hypothetical protein
LKRVQWNIYPKICLYTLQEKIVKCADVTVKIIEFIARNDKRFFFLNDKSS